MGEEIWQDTLIQVSYLSNSKNNKTIHVRTFHRGNGGPVELATGHGLRMAGMLWVR